MTPDPVLFGSVEKSVGLAAGALLSADDGPDYSAAERTRDWLRHLFEHPQGWAARRVAAGLLMPQEGAE